MRVLVNEWEHGRVERAEWIDAPSGEPRRACVKCGPRPRVEREALLYTAFLDPPRDPVPMLRGHRPLDGAWLLALEWVDGRRADFADAADVARVCEALGAWLGGWSNRVQDSRAGGTALHRGVEPALHRALEAFYADRLDEGVLHQRLAARIRSALERAALVGDGIRPHVWDALRQCSELAPEVAKRIAALPETLDWGDFSENNLLIRQPGGEVVFLDFEFAALRPVPLVLECLSEPYGTVPQADLRELAVERFAAGWNRSAARPVALPIFRASVAAAWIHYKVSEIDGWRRSWAEGGQTGDLREWLETTAQSLLGLVAEMKAP